MITTYLVEYIDCNNNFVSNGFTNANTLRKYVMQNKFYFSKMKFYKSEDAYSFFEVSYPTLERLNKEN